MKFLTISSLIEYFIRICKMRDERRYRMKYNKLMVISILAVFLISCHQETTNNEIDNTINNVVEENDAQNEKSDSEESIIEKESIGEVKLLPVSKIIEGDKKWGYASSNDLNLIMIDFRYDQPVFFDETHGFAIVSKDEQVGVIDEQGQELIPFGVYKSLYLGGEDLIYGQTQEEITKILDYNGNVYHTLKEGMNISLEENGFLQIYDMNSYNYFDVQTKQVIKLESEDYDIKKYDMLLANTSFEIQKGADQKLSVRKENIPLSEETYDSVEYIEDYFIIGNQSDKMEGYYESINALGLMDKDGHILIDPYYYDLKQLHENYFAVAEFDNFDLNYKQYSDQTYKKAIFRRAEALTGFDFYIIEYVKDDIFYVYDGVEYYFLDVQKNKKVMSELAIDGPFKIHVLGEVIVFNYDSYDGTYTIYANEDKILKRFSKSYSLTDGLVLTKFKGAGINPVFYPLLAYNNSDVEKKINMSIEELFDVTNDVDIETERYFSINNVGFDVSEFHDVLEVTQSYYWYGLGAAHGNYGNSSYNYDLKTGELIDLKDFFKLETNIDEVIAFSIKDVVLASEELAERLYVTLSELTDEEVLAYFKRDVYNYKVNSEGMIIYYNPYDIGPYAAGVIEIQLPLDSFKEHLKSKTPWFLN